MGEATTVTGEWDSTRILQLGEYKTKVDLAAGSIRRAIASGQLARGQRLRFSDLIRSLGISATPIREAVRVLEAEGLMSVDSHREIRVADFTIADAVEIYDVRAVLEGRATQQAAARLTEAEIVEIELLLRSMRSIVASGNLSEVARVNASWHEAIYASGSSKYLRFLIDKLWVAFPWDTMWIIPGRAELSMTEHERILEAIKLRHPAQAARLMRAHILGSKESLIEHLKRQGQVSWQREPTSHPTPAV